MPLGSPPQSVRLANRTVTRRHPRVTGGRGRHPDVHSRRRGGVFRDEEIASLVEREVVGVVEISRRIDTLPHVVRDESGLTAAALTLFVVAFRHRRRRTRGPSSIRNTRCSSVTATYRFSDGLRSLPVLVAVSTSSGRAYPVAPTELWPPHRRRSAPVRGPGYPDRLTGPIAAIVDDLQRVELSAREIAAMIRRELEDVATGSRPGRRADHRRGRCLRDAVDISMAVEAYPFVRFGAECRPRDRRPGLRIHFIEEAGECLRHRGSGSDGCLSGRISSAMSSVRHGVHTIPSIGSNLRAGRGHE